MKITGKRMKRRVALLVSAALLLGVLPMKEGEGSWAAQQSALRNPRILKTTQEVTPGSGGQKELKNPTTENGITTWDSIWFGNYWQEDTNGDGEADKNDEKQPIKWRVLSVDGDDVFLLADKNIDVQKYNDTDTGVTWETCTMRSWLNGYGAEANSNGKDYSDNNFLDHAFTEEEQSMIRTTNVVNNDNPEYNTEGGNDTSDQVYLLSIDEVMNPAYGFTSDADYTKMREAANTSYVAGGGEIKSDDMNSAGSNDAWWLRSPGSSSDSAASVNFYGNVTRLGHDVINRYASVVVRPALHLNLSSTSSWSYAGTVISDDIAEWDCVWFGNYWQEDTDADGIADKDDVKTPIKWRVLSVNGNDAFLVADKNLDVQKYNDTSTDVTWETCTMRSWLNGYGAGENAEGTDYSSNSFMINAFSESERLAIRTANVVNGDNSYYDTEGGNDTSDQVYLLSLDEVMNPAYGFASNINMTKMREAVNTSYVAGGGEIKSDDMNSAGSSDAWWLRSPGNNSDYAAYVFYYGYVSRIGNIVRDGGVGVRPALHLNLSSTSSWSYAGTVNSEGEEKEEAFPHPTEPGNTQKPEISAVPETTKNPVQTGKSTEKPSVKPSNQPDADSTPKPSMKPDAVSTTEPSIRPSIKPGNDPSAEPSVKPDGGSTSKPSVKPDDGQTSKPSVKPDDGQQSKPSAKPDVGVTPEPSSKPDVEPSAAPGAGPTFTPGNLPPIITPGIQPSASPNVVSTGKVSAVKLKQKKQGVTVSWKKVSGAAGYQICYSTSKKWKNKKQKLSRKNKLIVKKLKKKKTYYFRVRAYRMNGAKKVYGAWSKARKIKIKK